MTYYSDDGGDGRREEVVPDLTVTIEADDNNSDYVKLMPSPDEDSPLAAAEEPSVPSRRSVVWYWVKLVLLFLCLGFLAVAVLKWVGPYLIDKEVIPIINWETKTFSPPVLTIFLFASVALFPTLLLPSSPSMWVAGMTFGYGFGFLLIISAAAIGVSLPFFIGTIFLHHRIETQPTLTQNHSALSPSHTQPFLLSHSHTQPTLTPNPRRDTQNRRIRRTHPPFLSLKIIHAFTQNPLFLSPEIIHAERTLPFSASNPLLLRNHQKGYSRLRPLSYRGADIFVLAFSLISIASYENVLKKWMPELRRFAPNVPIVLVGTKLDLRENRGYFDDHMGYNVISSAEGEELRKQIGAVAYIECSSKTQQNVKAVFDTAIKVVLQPPRRKEMATKKRHRRSGCSLVIN